MAATASILALVALQLITRESSVALSIALARGLGARFYGLANVQLQLISSSALFLSKEGLRRACQRVYAGGAGSALAHGMNLAWLSVPITAAVAVACAYYVITRGRPEELAQLVRNKKVEAEEALARSVDKDDLAKRIGRPVQHSGAHSV